jgi:hypothetical protein
MARACGFELSAAVGQLKTTHRSTAQQAPVDDNGQFDDVEFRI